MKTFILAIFLATTAIANAAAQGYPGPQGGSMFTGLTTSITC